MGQSNCKPTVYDCQVQACKEVFQKKLPCGCPPIEAPFNGRPVYDISGFDAHQVVGVLSAIVNDKDQFTTNQTFYLLIRGSPQNTLEGGFEEFFRLKARPTRHQPGNAIVFLRPRGKKLFNRSANSYEELNGALRANYDWYDNRALKIFSDTTCFARHIKQLFKNNATIDDLPQPSFEVYMLFLFEIARRLVNSENPSKRKEAFDDLPIGSAIARLLTLLEFRRCSFEDVLFPGGRFHCFSDSPEKRKTAIHNINMEISVITGQETLEKKHHVKELQELFCSKRHRAEMAIAFRQGQFLYPTSKPYHKDIRESIFVSLMIELIIILLVIMVALTTNTFRRTCNSLSTV